MSNQIETICLHLRVQDIPKEFRHLTWTKTAPSVYIVSGPKSDLLKLFYDDRFYIEGEYWSLLN